ncbi:MAG: glutamine synthetase [Candidatus Sericytochromatia bacterium]|nr:MAG: glutamine synthetase [Candidatus Sericytochromatia bacterium]
MPGNFLNLSYEELEEKNLEAKKKASNHESNLKEYYLEELEKTKSIKAVTIAFTDLQGKFLMLDYDKKFFIKSYDNLTFDGSSVRGFSQVRESDLRLDIDWSSFRYVPADILGAGKVLLFGLIKNVDGSDYESDMRLQLKNLTKKLWDKDKSVVNVAVELEGFLFDGLNAEQNYDSRVGFKFVSTGGYYNSLPQEKFRLFVDKFAEVQRALGFENEKDHPEVAPSQFELNYSYCDALISCDQIQLYKLIARQIAANMGLTASFLPKPVADINGNGMHTNISISRDGENLFYSENGQDNLSPLAWNFVDRILNNANDLCLILNSSVNSYRRLDPNYEAPNQIKSSAIDRTSMIRIPLANRKSARIEIRSVAPDCNPYLLMYSLIRTGLEGPMPESLDNDTRRTRTRFLPDNIYDAIKHFKSSEFIKSIIGENNHSKFIDLKQEVAERSPKQLGTIIKDSEILFHHEVTNQYLWNKF